MTDTRASTEAKVVLCVLCGKRATTFDFNPRTHPDSIPLCADHAKFKGPYPGQS